MDQPEAPDTVVDALVSGLRREILTGLYPPGSYLPPERELAARYGVTRTSLKHALVRLGQLGLLETRHGIGSRVRDYERSGGAALLPLLAAEDPRWAQDASRALRLLLAFFARQAAENATAADRTRLRDRLAALPKADDPGAVEREIYRLIALASGNRAHGLLLNSLLDACPRPAAGGPGDLASLVEAVCCGDGEAAWAEALLRFAKT